MGAIRLLSLRVWLMLGVWLCLLLVIGLLWIRELASYLAGARSCLYGRCSVA